MCDLEYVAAISAADVPEVKELHDACLPIQYPSSFYDKLLKKEFRTFLCLDKSSSKIVGVCTVQRVDRCLWESDMYIGTICVDEQYRRRGVGTMFMDLTIEKAKSEGCSSVFLDVLATNEAAITFYEGHGFSIHMTKPRHYYFDKRRHDALEMRLTLEQGMQRIKVVLLSFILISLIGCYFILF